MELALSLMMPPNANAKCKKKKDAVKIFNVCPEDRLVTFTCKIFGIPLSKSSPYTLYHCLGWHADNGQTIFVCSARFHEWSLLWKKALYCATWVSLVQGTSAGPTRYHVAQFVVDTPSLGLGLT
jgi:hypothetical protein